MRLFPITEAISYHIESMSPVAFEKTDIAKFLAMSVFFFFFIYLLYFSSFHGFLSLQKLFRSS